MQIEFKTIEENGKTVVVYIRDGIETTKWDTIDALQFIIKLMQRVEADPHMIFNIHTTIIGAIGYDLQLSQN